MAEDLGKLVVTIGADIAQLKQNVHTAINELGKYKRETDKQLTSVNKIWSVAAGGIKTAIAAIGISIGIQEMVEFTKSAVQAGVQIDTLTRSFNAITGSANKTASEFEFIGRIADDLGLSLTDLEQSYKGILAASKGTALEGQKLREVFESTTKAIAVLGLTAYDTRLIFYAYEQMLSKGVVSQEELRRQLGERLYGAFVLTAKAMGVTTMKLNEMIASGEVLSSELIPKLASQLDKEWGGAAVSAGQRAAASFERLRNELVRLKRAVAESGLLDFFASLAKYTTSILHDINVMIKGPSLKEVMDQRVKAQEKLNKLLEDQNQSTDEYEKLYKKIEIEKTQNEVAELDKKLELLNEQKNISRELSRYQTKETAPQEEFVSEKQKREQEQRAEASRKLTDEIKKLTMEEYAYKEWAAQQETEMIKRKYGENSEQAKLAAELEKATLFDIQKERQEKLQQLLDEQKDIYTDAYKQQLEDQKELNDKIKEAELDKFDYKQYLLRKETEALTEKYYGDIEMLDKVRMYYQSTYKKIEKERQENLEKENKETITILERLEASAKKIFSNIEDFFAEIGEEGKNTFRDFADSVIKDLKRIIAQTLITDPLRNWFTDFMKGFKDNKETKNSTSLSSLFGGFDLAGLGASLGSSISSFDPFNLISFDTGGQLTSTGGKKAFPIIAHEGEVIGQPEQMQDLFGGNGQSNVTINVMAMDSESAYEFARRNPGAFLEPFHEALRSAGPTRDLIKETVL